MLKSENFMSKLSTNKPHHKKEKENNFVMMTSTKSANNDIATKTTQQTLVIGDMLLSRDASSDAMSFRFTVSGAYSQFAIFSLCLSGW